MTVKELIEFLETQPQDLDVAYEFCSDYTPLSKEEIQIVELGLVRPDGHKGYIERKRPDKPSKLYLVFPGN